MIEKLELKAVNMETDTIPKITYSNHQSPPTLQPPPQVPPKRYKIIRQGNVKQRKDNKDT